MSVQIDAQIKSVTETSSQTALDNNKGDVIFDNILEKVDEV